MDTSEHYDNPFYPRSVQLERMCRTGKTAEQVCEAETKFVLPYLCNLGKDGGILDLMCGTGIHASLLEKWLGVPILGIDGASNLIELACKNENLNLKFIKTMASDISRGMFNFKVRAVTCFGSSFQYHNHADQLHLMRSLFDLLEPEGLLTFQFRELDDSAIENVCTLASLGRNLGSPWLNLQEVSVFSDPDQGDSLYDYVVSSPISPDLANPTDYKWVKVGKGHYFIWIHEENELDYYWFSRTYTEANGTQHHFRPTLLNGYLRANNFPLVSQMLVTSGFSDVKLISGPDIGGGLHLFSVIARKRG